MCALVCSHSAHIKGVHTQGWAGCLHCRLYQRLQQRRQKALLYLMHELGKHQTHLAFSVQFQSHLWGCCTSVPVSDSGGETVFMKCFPCDPFGYPAALYRDESHRGESFHSPWPLDSVQCRLLLRLWGWRCGKYADVPTPSGSPHLPVEAKT